MSSPETLTSTEDRPQTPPSYLSPLVIETATGVYFLPFTIEREEIAAYVERMHFILTPEMDRMLAALDLRPSRPADHVDEQPQQVIDVKRGESSNASSRGKGALKRVRDETVEVGDKRQGPTKKMRSNTPGGVTAQGDVAATAEHRPEPQPLNGKPYGRSSSSD